MGPPSRRQRPSTPPRPSTTKAVRPSVAICRWWTAYPPNSSFGARTCELGPLHLSKDVVGGALFVRLLSVAVRVMRAPVSRSWWYSVERVVRDISNVSPLIYGAFLGPIE